MHNFCKWKQVQCCLKKRNKFIRYFSGLYGFAQTIVMGRNVGFVSAKIFSFPNCKNWIMISQLSSFSLQVCLLSINFSHCTQIGIGLKVLQHSGGSNAYTYYSGVIFTSAGICVLNPNNIYIILLKWKWKSQPFNKMRFFLFSIGLSKYVGLSTLAVIQVLCSYAVLKLWTAFIRDWIFLYLCL